MSATKMLESQVHEMLYSTDEVGRMLSGLSAKLRPKT
jgi:hypothetical protein